MDADEPVPEPGSPERSQPEPAEEPHRVERASRMAIAAAIGLVLLMLLLVLVVDPLRDAAGDAISGDTSSLREDLRGLGFGGVMLTLALCVLHAFVFYPAEIVNLAAGFIYGFWWAMLLVMVGWLINGIICHQIGRHAARPALLRLLGEERFLRYEGVIARGGVTLLLAMRLVPIVPFSFFSYVAGSARVPLGTFIWTTAIGYIPITALFVLLGSRLEEISLTDPVLWGGTLVLLALLLLSKRVLPEFGK